MSTEDRIDTEQLLSEDRRIYDWMTSRGLVVCFSGDDARKLLDALAQERCDAETLRAENRILADEARVLRMGDKNMRERAEWKDAYDVGEVVGMKTNMDDTENPYPEGSNAYCGWSFGFWGARNASLRQLAEERIRLLEELVDDVADHYDIAPNGLRWREKYEKVRLPESPASSGSAEGE